MNGSNLQSQSLVIWRLLDGRPGHENQVQGLSEAIARRVRCQSVDIRIDDQIRGMKSLLPGRVDFAADFAGPDLLIGAGHGTHLPMIRLQRRFGGRSVVIMRPSLPTALFDLCLIPAHDGLSNAGKSVVTTEGAMNRMRPTDRFDSDFGVFLIGGPSRHFLWSDRRILDQIKEIVARSAVPFVVATSHRTPESFRDAFDFSGLHLPVKPAEEFDRDWLSETLSQSKTAWVTCDSMSMVYEAVTSGANVGLLELKSQRLGRVSRNVRRLADLDLATPYSDWIGGRQLARRCDFCEAERCAELVLERLLEPRSWSLPPMSRRKRVISASFESGQ